MHLLKRLNINVELVLVILKKWIRLIEDLLLQKPLELWRIEK
jgi:hypothetical protein